MKQRLLIVDDEPGIVDMMASYFSSQYEVLTAYCGNEALQKLARQPDLILLDINMPDIDGLTLCQKIRELITCPILFLTARVESADKIIGFQAGADDYIIKPFDLDELGARVAAHLRREQRHRNKATIRFFGELTIDYSARTVTVAGEPVALSKREFDIVELLSLNAGQVFDRERIYETVWGLDGEGNSDTVMEHIRKIRAKLAACTLHSYIDTVWALSFPKQWSFENFRQAMEVTDFWRSLGNSLLITLVTIVLAILIHSIAGYVIGRGMARRKSFRFIYLYIVSGMFVPFSILMMPLVKQTAHMGLGNRAGVIVLYLVFYMPMNVLLYSGYLKNIPEALEEAADIDGASTWTTYWKVVFPMMKPMHATVAILTALGTWNDVMTPLVIMSGTGQNTLPLAQLNFQTQFGTNYNLAFASYILALIPILIFYMICQKQILNGVANGAVKG